MADDVQLNSGSGGDVVAADDIGGIKFQRVKIALGANNTNDGDVASGNPMPVSGTVAVSTVTTVSTVTSVTAIANALPAGTNAIGKLAANSGVDIGDVDVTSLAVAAGATSIAENEDVGHADGDRGLKVWGRRIDTAATSAGSSGDYATMNQSAEGAAWVTTAPTTTSGCAIFMASGSDGSSILVATAQAAKASAGNLYGWYVFNPEAATTFVHFYNTAQGSVTVGTTNPIFTLAVPSGSAANIALPFPIAFSAAITVAATTTAGGNTAPATGASLVIWYK